MLLPKTQSPRLTARLSADLPDVRAVARSLSLDVATGEYFASGFCSTLFRFEHSLVRLAPKGTPAGAMWGRLCAWRSLADQGVPVCEITGTVFVSQKDAGFRVASFGPCEPAGFGCSPETLGQAVASLHAARLDTVDHLPGPVDPHLHAEILASLDFFEVISPATHRLLQDRLLAWSEPLAGPRVPLHGDLWAKNVIDSAKGPLLCDPETLGPGPALADIGMLLSSFDPAHPARWGRFPILDPDAIASGYGIAMPKKKTLAAAVDLHDLCWGTRAASHPDPRFADAGMRLLTQVAQRPR